MAKKVIALLMIISLVGSIAFAEDAKTKANNDPFADVEGVELTQDEMAEASGGDVFDLLAAKIEYGKNPYSPTALNESYNSPRDDDYNSIELILKTHGKNGTESKANQQRARAQEIDNAALNFIIPIDSAKNIIEGKGSAGDFFDVVSSVPAFKWMKGIKAAEKVAEVGRIASKADGRAENAVKATGRGVPTPKTLAQQAKDLVPLNGGKARVTLRSENYQLEIDLTGRSHNGIETPHVKESPRNFGAPEWRQPVYNTSEGKAIVRPATQQDIRLARRFLEQ